MKRLMFIIAAALVSCSLYAQNLTILHLNDTHSHIDPQRSGVLKGHGGVIEQAAYIDSVRHADGARNVLLLHAGDFSQGTSYFTELGGDIEIDVLNAAGYDVVALGNHEFDNGPVELARRLSDLDAEVVCANYDFTGSPLEGLVQPYVIVKKAGRKIGIIGLLTDISRVVDRSLIGNLEYRDPVQTVGRYAGFLKNEKGCDLVICLSHLGYHEDCEVASKTEDVDVFVGGHSHTWLDDMTRVRNRKGEDVIVVQDGNWGLTIGKLSVEF